jgi:cobalt/nickel transport system ATP-binding protein
MTEPLLRLHALCFAYPSRPVFEQVDFELHAGERVALLGANGVGKSTLLHLLVGLLRPDAGQIHAFGRERKTERDFREVRAQAGLLFQDPDDQLFCPTVLEDVAFGPLNLGMNRDEALNLAQQTLTDLGLGAFADRVTHKLSGGEKRLVSLATVLAMRPRVLLLDEPSNGLDEPTLQRLLGYLESLPQAMVLVSHDARLIERLANRAVLLQAGRLTEALLHRHPHAHAHSHLHAHLPGHEGEHTHADALLAPLPPLPAKASPADR